MKKILIVEDEIIIAMVLKKFLNDMEFNVIGTVKTEKDAIKNVKENLPDLVLMDVKLKDNSDGIEASKKIREFSDVPFIFTTGNEDVTERIKEIESAYFLLKPVDFFALKKIINRIWE